MKGLELARKYYEAFGIPMIHDQFPEYEEIIAAGLTGSGSECYGYDDEISRDHDFEPGFCLFLPGEDIVDRKTAFRLERAYAKLPVEFEGFHRQKISPVGGSRHGVFRIEDFFMEKIGCLPEDLRPESWLRIPEYALAEAVNGEIFRDDAGLMEDQRKILRSVPEDVRRKKLAGHLLLMAQSGQYNYQRCIRHGEPGAARLALDEFVRHAMSAVFLLHRRWMPYYKWSFRALRELPGEEEMSRKLETLLLMEAYSASPGKAAPSFPDALSPDQPCTSGKAPSSSTHHSVEDHVFQIEEIASRVIEMLRSQHLSLADCGDLEKHAYSVNDSIQDGAVRNLHVLYCM